MFSAVSIFSTPALSAEEKPRRSSPRHTPLTTEMLERWTERGASGCRRRPSRVPAAPSHSPTARVCGSMLSQKAVHCAVQAMVVDFPAAEIEVLRWQTPSTPW
jgi:hypothetical protein